MQSLLLQMNAGTNGVALLTLNRPEVINAINTPMWVMFQTALRELADDDSLRALVICGAGERGFSAGGDLKERNLMSNRDWERQHRMIEEILLTLRDLSRPTIAAVHGIAHGGGLEIPLMCDFVIADETVDFALPEVLRGFLPGGGGLQNLVRAIGVRKAKQMVYTGRRVKAREAAEWGIINEVVPAGQHLSRSLQLAAEISRGAPLAVKYAKQTLQHGEDVDFRAGYALDLCAHYLLVQTDDRLEGIRAFNEKRQPVWSQS
jgi:enoyl-CoA hydratase/carnithine racemase